MNYKTKDGLVHEGRDELTGLWTPCGFYLVTIEGLALDYNETRVTRVAEPVTCLGCLGA